MKILACADIHGDHQTYAWLVRRRNAVGHASKSTATS